MPRAGYVRDAAQRIYVGGGFPDLRTVPELFFGPHGHSRYVSPEEIVGGDGSELHAVGVYEARNDASGPKDPRLPRPVEVLVEATPRPVELFLMSHDAVEWRIEVAPAARLQRVHLSSYLPSTISPPSLSKSVHRIAHGPRSYSFEGKWDSNAASGEVLLRSIERIAACPVASFQGEYSGRRFRVPFYRDAVLLREVLQECHGIASTRRGALPAPLWVVDGGSLVHLGADEPAIPLPMPLARGVAHCPADGCFYVVDPHRLFVVAPGRSVRAVPTPKHVQWIGGITCDTKRAKLVMTTHWHTGFHHRFDPRDESWEPVPIAKTGGGLVSLAYEPKRDVIYGLSADPMVFALGGRSEIHILSPDLQLLGRVPHRDPLPLPSGIDMLRSTLQMGAFPSALVVLAAGEGEEEDFGRSLETGPRITGGFVVRLDRDEIQALALP